MSSELIDLIVPQVLRKDLNLKGHFHNLVVEEVQLLLQNEILNYSTGPKPFFEFKFEVFIEFEFGKKIEFEFAALP